MVCISVGFVRGWLALALACTVIGPVYVSCLDGGIPPQARQLRGTNDWAAPLLHLQDTQEKFQIRLNEATTSRLLAKAAAIKAAREAAEKPDDQEAATKASEAEQEVKEATEKEANWDDLLTSVGTAIPVIKACVSGGASCNGPQAASSLLQIGVQVSCAADILVPEGPIVMQAMQMIFAFLEPTTDSPPPLTQGDIKAAVTSALTDFYLETLEWKMNSWIEQLVGEFDALSTFLKAEPASQHDVDDFKSQMPSLTNKLSEIASSASTGMESVLTASNSWLNNMLQLMPFQDSCQSTCVASIPVPMSNGYSITNPPAQCLDDFQLAQTDYPKLHAAMSQLTTLSVLFSNLLSAVKAVYYRYPEYLDMSDYDYLRFKNDIEPIINSYSKVKPFMRPVDEQCGAQPGILAQSCEAVSSCESNKECNFNPFTSSCNYAFYGIFGESDVSFCDGTCPARWTKLGQTNGGDDCWGKYQSMQATFQNNGAPGQARNLAPAVCGDSCWTGTRNLCALPWVCMLPITGDGQEYFSDAPQCTSALRAMAQGISSGR